jgi:hypothetical protein
MALTPHVWPNVDQASLSKTLNLNNGDNLFVLLISSVSTFTWVASSEAYTTNSQFLTNAGSGAGGALTEVSTSGTGYTRQQLTGVALTTSGLVTTLTCNNPTWPSSTISAKYAMFFDAGTGGNGTSANDGTNVPLAYWDFGGTNSSSSGSFTLTISGSGLITWTAS